MTTSQDDLFTFSYPIRSVAVIGAGIAGLAAAAHLREAGCDIVVYERADTVGGAWAYYPQPDRDPPYPNVYPTPPDREDDLNDNKDLSVAEASMRFAPPGPVYTNMRYDGGRAIIQTSLLDWPPDTPDNPHHSVVLGHLREVARRHGLEPHIRFRTRVESVVEDEVDKPGKWLVRTARFVADPSLSSKKSTDWTLEKQTQRFDAVVVASGRYGAPRVPDIPGLATWHGRWPQRLRHAKQYRSPEPYVGRTVLIVGAFVSAIDIASELARHGVAHVYASARESPFDIREDDEEGVIESVPMVVEFSINESAKDTVGLDDADPLPGAAVLDGGRVLTGLDYVVLATGYITSFPFLGPRRQQCSCNSASAPAPAAAAVDDEVVVTADARGDVYNLHEDIFYIPDPTLAFIGVTQLASTFALFDVQAQVLAAVWAGSTDGAVRLPSQQVMRDGQQRRRRRVWPGVLLNNILLLDDVVMRRMLDWVNNQRAAAGQPSLPGPHPDWVEVWKEEREKSRRWIGPLQDHYLDINEEGA